MKEGERRGRGKSNEVLIRGVQQTTHENIQLVWEYSGTSEERTLWEWHFCPFFGGCPYLGGSLIL